MPYYALLRKHHGATQDVKPDSDDSVGNWTATPLWSKVNDDSDGTLISPPLAVEDDTTEVFIVGLEVPQTDANPWVGQTMQTRFRAQANVANGGTVNGILELRQGVTVIITHSEATLSTSITWYTDTLTVAEKKNINDWSDLNIRFTAELNALGAAGRTADINVYEVELAIT
jgi:hypothetical protein